MSARRKSRGFTLLETLVALAILGIALPTLLSAFSETISRTARADDRLETLRKAQNLLVLAVAEYPKDRGTRSGSDSDVTWQVETAPLEPNDGEREYAAVRIIPVRATVSVKSRRGAQTRLDTMFLHEEPAR